MKFGEKLRLLREEKGLSQKDVAERLKISLRTYASYELNQSRPRTQAKWEEIATFFGKDVDYLQIDDIDKKAAILESYRRDEMRLVYSRFEADATSKIVPFLEQLGWTVERESAMRHHKCDLAAYLPSTRIFFEFKVFSSHTPLTQYLYNIYGMVSTIPKDDERETYFFVISNTENLKSEATLRAPQNLEIPIKFFSFNQERKEFDSPEMFKLISSLSQ